jgi:exonuclease SbcD
MIKILHTADWHLGHRLHGVSRVFEHQNFLHWLVRQLQKTRADALLICGDIFDSANPSAQAQSMFYDFLLQAKQCCPQLDIVIIGGNHDSALRLEAPAQLLASFGIRVIGGLHSLSHEENKQQIDWQQLIVPLTNNKGEIKGLCGAMPFIRNADLSHESCAENATDPLIAGVKSLYHALYLAMQDYKEEHHLADIVQVFTGHCYMVGSEVSELSERRILGGNQHALPANLFAQTIDYVALGHLHKAQQVTYTRVDSYNNNKNNPHIHYSGSPIPLSFAEQNYRHQIKCITCDNSADNMEHSVLVQSINIPRAVNIFSIPNNHYSPLSELAALLDKQNFKPRHKAHELDSDTPMLEIKILLEKPEPDVRQQVDALLEDKYVRLLKLSLSYSGQGGALAEQQKQVTLLAQLQPQDVFEQCYQRQFEQAIPTQLSALFQQLLESVEEEQ